MEVSTRKPELGDEESWRRLFGAYQRFYRASVPDPVVAGTWARINAADSPVNGLVAAVDGRLVGLTHYVFHESTWSDRHTCYLEDLYVDPSARGSGAARALIEAVETEARAMGAFRLYWHTQQYNGAARSLYDSIMPPSSFMVYRKGL